MPVSSRLISRHQAAARRRTRAAHVPARVVPSLAAGLAATASAQRGGGPRDSALYQCDCGCHFHASVSTSVGCPACGGTQAW